jgi:hypothetical protein
MKPMVNAAAIATGDAERLARRHQRVFRAILVLLLLGGGMLAAGCGGSATPGVAGLGSRRRAPCPAA